MYKCASLNGCVWIFMGSSDLHAGGSWDASVILVAHLAWANIVRQLSVILAAAGRTHHAARWQLAGFAVLGSRTRGAGTASVLVVAGNTRTEVIGPGVRGSHSVETGTGSAGGGWAAGRASIRADDWCWRGSGVVHRVKQPFETRDVGLESITF